jgi:hypothetical protein
LAEKFLNAADGGGFYVGNSRNGWHSIPIQTTLSPKLDKEFFKSIFDAGEYYYHLGQVHAEAKHKRVGAAMTNAYERYCQYELTLLGDPEMPVWKNTPEELTVTHATTLPLGPSTFPVQVLSGGSGVEGARVCLWKGDEVYEVLETDASGNANFNPSPSTFGTVYVTATLGDYLPYEGEATAGELLSADTYTLSESTGGIINFTLTAGSGNGSRNYILLGSMSGTEPGIPLPGGMATLPLNWDFYTTFVFNMLNTPIFDDFMGVLDAGGNATAQYNSFGPLPPGFVGMHMYYAYAINKPWDFVSNYVDIEIVP